MIFSDEWHLLKLVILANAGIHRVVDSVPNGFPPARE